jgi:hypothetical protein
MNANQPAQERLGAYLGDVATSLFGPRRRRERILDELRDGLVDAVADRTAAGLPADRAVLAAIEDFGRPGAVADSFAAELAVAYARRTIGWFIATGPLVGVWWLLVFHLQPWRAGVVALVTAIPVVPLIAVALAIAADMFATTGRLMRWVPEAGPRRALLATTAVAVLALTGDVLVIVLYGLSTLSVWPLGLVAVAASLTRIVCSILVVRRSVALRRRITNAHR